MKPLNIIIVLMLACLSITSRAGDRKLDELKKLVQSATGVFVGIEGEEVKPEDLEKILRLHDIIKKRFNLKAIRSGRNTSWTLWGLDSFEVQTRGVLGVDLEGRFDLVFEYGYQADYVQTRRSQNLAIEIYNHQTIPHNFTELLQIAQKVLDDEKAEQARMVREEHSLDEKQKESEKIVREFSSRFGISIELPSPSPGEDFKLRKERIERTLNDLTEAKDAIARVYNRLGLRIVGDQTRNDPRNLKIYAMRIDEGTQNLGNRFDFKGLAIVEQEQYGVSFDQGRGILLVPWQERYQRDLISELQKLAKRNSEFIRTEPEGRNKICDQGMSGS